MHRVCCCGGCPQSCCDFWACSPSAPISITLSGTSENYDTCDNGFDYVYSEATWTITATLTRSGVDCDSYRYSANTADLEITYKTRVFADTTGAICDAPPAPCQFDHCGDCSCHPPSREVCELRTWTYNGPINGGGGGCIIDPRYASMVPANALITIACAANQCDHPCVNPVLIWTPDNSCEESSCECGCKEITKTVTCGSVACCDTDANCGTTISDPVCLNPFILIGRGCLNAETFDNARASPYNAVGGPPTSGDPLAIHALREFPYSAASGACRDPVLPPNDVYWPPTCSNYTFARKECDYCWYGIPDTLRTCYRLDPENPSNVIEICTPEPPCCSSRSLQTITWNLS